MVQPLYCFGSDMQQMLTDVLWHTNVLIPQSLPVFKTVFKVFFMDYHQLPHHDFPIICSINRFLISFSSELTLGKNIIKRETNWGSLGKFFADLGNMRFCYKILHNELAFKMFENGWLLCRHLVESTDHFQILTLSFVNLL